MDEEKGVYKGRAREWPGRPIDGRRSDNNFCQVMIMRANQKAAAESGERSLECGMGSADRPAPRLRRGRERKGGLAVGSR